MKDSQNEIVEPVQGTEPTENQRFKQVKRMLKTDLKTARVICHIAGTDEDVANAVMVRLQKDVKNVPDGEGISKDALIASAAVSVIIENDMVLDYITEVVIGLQDNLNEKRKREAVNNKPV